MSPNCRIFLNIVATYGRSLYALLLGIFTARWALIALGVTDYGLMGVVGGLTAFVEFFNNLLSSSIGRFYGFYIGAAKVNSDKTKGIEYCRKWFNTALLIHTVLPIVLIIIGYPLGAWAVRSFLVIPADRVADCVWVWRFACVSCFVGMVSVPFSAMYYAKQEIAELTLYSVVSTTLKAMFLYYMVSHPGVWLAKYALWGCFVFVLPQMIICVRAVICYNECRFNASYLWDKSRMHEIGIYALSRLWPTTVTICNDQGQAILVNKLLGPESNSSMTIGNCVAAHAQTLSAALSNAFNPAIVNLAGAGEFCKMRDFAYRACKISTILLLIFVIPLSLEIDEVMILWLKTPPPLAGELCVLMLVVSLLEKLTDGHWMSILAIGRIGKYSFVVGWSGFAALLLSWGFLGLGWGILSVGAARIITKLFEVCVRLYFGRSLAGLSPRYWLKKVVIPIALVTSCSLVIGLLPRFFFEQTFLRCVITIIAVEVVIFPMIWFVVLEETEKSYLIAQVRKRFKIRPK